MESPPDEWGDEEPVSVKQPPPQEEELAFMNEVNEWDAL
jgi:hypothetical protein